MQAGVESAAVNLVLEKASVVFDGRQVTAEALVEAVDDIGFESALLCQGPALAADEEGQAHLHLEVVGEQADSLCAFALKLDGVLAADALDAGILRLVYRPSVVGARSLLGRFRSEAMFGEVRCAPPQDGSQVADLQRQASRLWFNFRCSALPALLVFALTILFPAAGVDLGTVDFRAVHFHIATLLVLALATPVQFVFGADFHVQARKALARRAPNMDVLVSLATSISFAYASLVLVSKVCRIVASQPHSEAMYHPGAALAGHGDSGALSVGLGCHALHFFGMAPILMTVVLGGKLLETKAKIQTMDSLVKLMDCKSSTARLIGEEKEETIPLELVQLGDKLRLFEGCQVPCDGELVSEGTLWVSEALLTGESAPVAKTARREGEDAAHAAPDGACSALLGGSAVVGGGGAAVMRATAVGSKTALGEIVALISSAQATKTQAQRLASTIAGYFVSSVMALSLLVFLAWFALLRSGRVAVPEDFDEGGLAEALFAAKFGVAVLMVACPCAMGLATPTAIMVASGVAARLGCLVKSAEALETGAAVRAVVLDKTGTLTEGAPRVTGMLLVRSALGALPQGCLEHLSSRPAAPQGGAEAEADLPLGEQDEHEDKEELTQTFWSLVGAVEAGSDHPLAKCLTSRARAATRCESFPATKGFRCMVGRGVCATTIEGGVEIRVGSFAFLKETLAELRLDASALDCHYAPVAASDTRPVLERVEAWAVEQREAQDSVVVAFAVVRGEVLLLGAIAARDALRLGAAAAVRTLTEELGLEVWMCTGDGRVTALAIAEQVGIPKERVVAEALPKQKADTVAGIKRDLRAGGAVCVVGDGVNDAPALAAGDVGIAIGAGAHLAMDAADIVLVKSELRKIAAYIELSKATLFTIRRNFVWAFIFNFCGLPLAAGLFYPRVVLPPLVAGIAMGLSSALVVSSSLMLKRFRPRAGEVGLAS